MCPHLWRWKLESGSRRQVLVSGVDDASSVVVDNRKRRPGNPPFCNASPEVLSVRGMKHGLGSIMVDGGKAASSCSTRWSASQRPELQVGFPTGAHEKMSSKIWVYIRVDAYLGEFRACLDFVVLRFPPYICPFSCVD